MEAGGDSDKNLYHKKPVELTTKVTKRPYLKIMEKIRLKLFERLQTRLGEEHGQGIMEALNDRQIEQSIKKMMKEDRIRLLNDQNEPVYQKQISYAGAYLENDHVGAGKVDYTSGQEIEECEEPVTTIQAASQNISNANEAFTQAAVAEEHP